MILVLGMSHSIWMWRLKMWRCLYGEMKDNVVSEGKGGNTVERFFNRSFSAPLGAFTPSSPSSLWHLLSCHRFAFHSLAPYKFKMHNLASWWVLDHLRLCVFVVVAENKQLICLLSWRDGRALGAIIAKFIPDSLDYLKLLAMEEEEARIKVCNI